MVKNNRPDFIFILFFNFFESYFESDTLRQKRNSFIQVNRVFSPNRSMWFYCSECDVHSSWHVSLEKNRRFTKNGVQTIAKIMDTREDSEAMNDLEIGLEILRRRHLQNFSSITEF